MKIKLGDKYRDTVSGFEGTATSNTEYLNGCVRVSLMAEAEAANKEPVELVFDIQQLEKVKARRNKAPKERTGGTRPATPRTGLKP